LSPRATLFLCLAALWGCGGSKLPTQSIVVDGHTVSVEIASTQASQQEGLMNRDTLGTDKGMLFVYPDKKPRNFWMKDTRIPLAIAFIEDDGTILKIAHMRPQDMSRTKSLYPVSYALEMNEGWFVDNSVQKGDKIEGMPPKP
jgi:hypothetical protein